MERIGTHRVFRLDSKEGIAEFDAYRKRWAFENRVSISEETGIAYRDTHPGVPSGVRVRRTIPPGYAPTAEDAAYHYFSSPQALIDSLEVWKISSSTPTNPPIQKFNRLDWRRVMPKVESANQTMDANQLWAQIFMR